MTTTRENAGRAAIYARISRDKAGEALGVERQLEDCRRYCANQGWTSTEYVDNDLSASKRKVERPNYQRMLADIVGRKVDVVVVWDIDRLTRQPLELETFAIACEDAGMTEDIHTATGGRLTLLYARIKGALAAEESRKTSERFKRQLQQKAEMGQPHGTRSFGFNDDRVSINEVEASLIREAAQHILEGGSLRSIGTKWNELGLTGVHGKPFNSTSVKKILTSPRVAGLRQHQGEVIGKAVWPEILDEPTWKAVCVALTDPGRRTPRPSREYPLRGVATCALCGSYLVARPRNGGRRYGCVKELGGCGKVASINADPFEQHVFDIVLPLADSPEILNVLRSEDEGTTKSRGDLVQANAEDQATLNQLDDDYADKLLSRQAWMRQHQRLSERIAARDAELATMHGHSRLEALSGHVQADWDTMSADDKRAVVQGLVSRIAVSPVIRHGSNKFEPGRVDIVFKAVATGLYFKKDEAGQMTASRRLRAVS